MTSSDTTILTAQDIQAIEQRAYAMRSEAIAQIFRAAGAALVKAMRKVAGIFQRPHHA
ncbi:RSP_7527 family protein [Phycobacter sp. K97]|uniref:RSP_7527 family protein n=1 Tax=Phycobacter sedimenti TaxID=3133977 RepID=UPI00311E24A7